MAAVYIIFIYVLFFCFGGPVNFFLIFFEKQCKKSAFFTSIYMDITENKLNN